MDIAASKIPQTAVLMMFTLQGVNVDECIMLGYECMGKKIGQVKRLRSGFLVKSKVLSMVTKPY